MKDIEPGSGRSSNPFGLVNVGGTLFFSATDSTNGPGIWKSDGTPEGTVRVAGIAATELANVDGTLYFAGDEGSYGDELWKLDASPTNIALSTNIVPVRQAAARLSAP